MWIVEYKTEIVLFVDIFDDLRKLIIIFRKVILAHESYLIHQRMPFGVIYIWINAAHIKYTGHCLA